MSLIGTFSGTGSTEKWDPAVSTLYQVPRGPQSAMYCGAAFDAHGPRTSAFGSQVLVSIQGQILVKQPIENEPGWEEGKLNEDDSHAREYNAKVRLSTIRHAMTAQLRSPPEGFESVVRAHFAAQRTRVLQQAWAWTVDAPPSMRDKMIAALTQLHAALPPAPAAAAEPAAASVAGGGAGGAVLAEAAPKGARCLGGAYPPPISAGPTADADADLYD